MAHADANIWIKDLKVGDLVDTGGVFYGPYNTLTCLAITENRIAVHVKGHKQYWSQTTHYIPAQVYVFEKISTVGHRWACRNIFERECGRHSRAVKAEAIQIAQENSE